MKMIRSEALWFMVWIFFSAATLAGGWQLDETSSINFISIKNNSIGESNGFTRIEGQISNDGYFNIEVDLSSVETGIGIRNQRLQQLLFEVVNFPKATISGQLNTRHLALAMSEAAEVVTLPVAVTLHGMTADLGAVLSIVSSSSGLRVSSVTPILIRAQDFNLESGVAALQQIAGLNAISRSIPVTVNLLWNPV